ncbi:DUF882 domain-containing protein [Oceanobacter kriegii]|uniref:DUF882 domain-containing protein n=1 Tax=Oceanobacter kriegii TaxID=64972 RepID=UPI000489E76B|nr:DUF882 domain-containing protein [Oceanobacter kriegii]
MQRRGFLRSAVQLTSGLWLAGASHELLAGQQVAQGERTLKLYNIHTGETIKSTYWADGHYIKDELQQLDYLLRDHRSGGVNAIQRGLYDRIHYLQQTFASREPVYIISGYRSPKSNSSLRKTTSGVAEGSLHMQGRAVDIRIPGVSHRSLHKAAVGLGEGGVGYYPRSGFIHIDTGRTRRWTA